MKGEKRNKNSNLGAFKRFLAANFAFLLPSAILNFFKSKEEEREFYRRSLASYAPFHALSASLELFVILVFWIVFAAGGGFAQLSSRPAYVYSLCARILVTASSFFVLCLEIHTLHRKRYRYGLLRLSEYVEAIGLGVGMYLFFYGDLLSGYLNNPDYEVISPCLMWLVLLAVIPFSYPGDHFRFSGIFTLLSLILLFLSAYYAHLVDSHVYALALVSFAVGTQIFDRVFRYIFAQRSYIEKRNEELYLSSTIDPLTKLPNRNGLRDFLQAEEQPLQQGKNVLVAIFDVDDFKLYNDQFSHLAGDSCLLEVSSAVAKAIPAFRVFRYGGEEFLIVGEVADLAEAKATLLLAMAAVHGLQLKAPLGAPKAHVTISVGAHCGKSKGLPGFRAMLAKADSYLYERKRGGKDSINLNGKILS